MTPLTERIFGTQPLALVLLASSLVMSLNGVGSAVAQKTETEAMSTDSVEIQVGRHDDLGAYLTDGEGRALYLFKADTSGASTCYDQCASVWPPLLTDGVPQATNTRVRERLLGTIERKGGQMQVTYSGWPLYYFAKDDSPGQTRGQDVEGFGAEWYLISPAGQEVHAESEEEGQSGSGGARNLER